MRHAGALSIIALIITVILITGCSPKGTTTPLSTTTTTTTSAPTPTGTLLPHTTEPETILPTTTPPAVTTTTSPPTVKRFQAISPAIKFTAEDIAFLGIDFTGSQEHIEDMILKWQEDNWTFVSSQMDYPDVSDPIRWNYFLPGIFTSRDIIHEQVKDNHIYGVCFSYAITYASIAEYYGLEVRVVNSISKPSQSNPGSGFTTGMSPEEYARLKAKLDAAGLDYAYEAVRLVAEETPSHYWAEVKINGEWVVKDATQKITGNDTKTGFIDKNDFEITDWLSRDKSPVLDDYQSRLDRGERLPETATTTNNNYTTITAASDYTGITDELGQKQRAGNIDDVLKALAPVPYLNHAADAFAFIKAEGISQGKIDVIQQFKDTYEERSGQEFYAVAFLMCMEKTFEEVPGYYYYLCGAELDMTLYQQLEEQIMP
jgi:hypothetical protein